MLGNKCTITRIKKTWLQCCRQEVSRCHTKGESEDSMHVGSTLGFWRRLLLRLGHLKCIYGRSGKFPGGGRPIVLRQLLLWWLNSPWAPGHIGGVSVMLMVVVVLLFSVLVQGLTKVSDQSHALEDRNDSDNSLEVYTPNSFIHLFYNSLYMDVVDMHNILIIPSDSVLWEKTVEAS